MDHDPILTRLRAIVGDRYVSIDPAELWCYTGNMLPVNPQAVVLPGNVDQVVKVIQLATETRTPVIPRGFATRNTPRRPGVHPKTEGGWILETTRLKAIREINLDNMSVTAEAGVTMAQLCNHLAPLGYRVIEGSMASYCATVGALTGVGPGLRKYGRRETQILDIEAIVTGGKIIHTAESEGKGFNLTSVFCGSQGLACLGVTTAVTYQMNALPEALEYLNFEFKNTTDTVWFLTAIDQASPTNYPGIFQVNVWPQEVFKLYANMPWIKNQNSDWRRLLSRYPPFPNDIVGIIIEGNKDQVDAECHSILKIAAKHHGIFVGPEPIRDYFVDRNWNGNTKCHEDVARQTTSWTEPFFLCRIKDYSLVKELVVRVAEECGFNIGERFWARATLRKGWIGFTVCVTFDDTDQSDRTRAVDFVDQSLQRATEAGFISSGRNLPGAVSDAVLHSIKEELDPLGIMFPGIFYLD